MKQIIFLILGFCTTCVTVSADEQYLLHIDVVGYIDSTEVKPKDKVLYSIETVARPNQPFHCKVKSGPETQIISGKLHYKEGEYSVQIRYHRTFDDGNTVLGKPVLDESGIQTTATVAVDESIVLGGFEIDGESTFEPQTKTKAKKYLIPNLSKVIDKFGTKEKAGTVLLSKTKTTKKVILLLSKYEPAAE